VTVEITDMLGQEVYTENITAKNGKIDHQVTLANNLANGMYILNLRTTDGSKIYHFVIEQ
jgi:5-hydroxyisourate hydrolase-like protein (transthyretin family)